jgi:hypothetical protein
MQISDKTRFAALYRSAALILATIMIAGVSAFAQSGGIKGTVRNMRGAGIPGATITARQNGEDVKSATANNKGDFVLSGLGSGVYNLVFEAHGYASGVLYKVEIKKNNIANLGNRLILSPDQGSLVIIKGSVFYKEGTSLLGAKVDLDRVNADGSIKKIASTTTNLSGEFTFKQPEGTAKFRITAKYGSATASKEIEAAEPAIYRLAITLDISRTK